MKRLTALLLAALMTLSFAACAKEPAETTLPSESTAPTQTDPPPVTEPEVTYPANFVPEECQEVSGTWYVTVTLDGKTLNMNDMEGRTSFQLIYSFTERGTYSIGMNQTAFSNAIAEYETLLSAYMMDSYYAKFAAECRLQGMGTTKTQEAWEESRKAEAQAQVDSYVAGLDLTSRFAGLPRSGTYYVADGRLYTSIGDGVYESSAYQMQEGKLVLMDCDNLSAYPTLTLRFPLTLTPV